MASSSSSSTSSVQKSFKYDVFLSFRGEDTRKTFVDHLYHALQQKSIHTYKDDERIKKGERIGDELIKSIEDSKFYIIVFSRNYASSSWCLDELVKIIECQKTTSEHTAYPVFYDVEPTEVRKQSGQFGEAFAKQEKEEAAEKWREALKEAANLSGFELKKSVDGHEAKFIQKIVEEISLELRSINVDIDEKLVGMETRIKDVVSSLEMGFDDVRMIGIKGMGGAGKTTLARAVFDHISFEFEGSSFVENVRENSNPNLSGLKKLQEQVLKDVSNCMAINISSVHDGKKMMKKRMCCIKVLVVLDDVDNIHQLEALAGERNWFKPGSRIIITTRDEQPLVAHRINSILYASLLSKREALCLFSRYAFGKEIPIQGYEELSEQVVFYAAGLPLALTVLGSFLCGKNELEWKNAIQRLKTIPSKETFDILEISYNGLEEEYKDIFLDVACIFKGFDKDDAIKSLESCGFYATIGLRVLEQKSLITIDKYGCLDMHDQIEEMGQYIVRRKNEEPNKHSRLWITEEIEDVLVSDQGTNEAIICINFFTWKLNPETIMNGLGSMKKLRFLKVCLDGVGCINNNWKFDADRPYFPNALRSLRWTGYPFPSLPESFQANNLVELNMPGSKIVQLWKGGNTKVLNKLRFLDLSNSKLKNLDLGLTPNLETLDLEGCSDLVELHMSGECSKLISLKVSWSKLTTLDLRGIPNLETLDLDECVDLVELHIPGKCLKLKSIKINGSKLRTLDLRGTPNLEELNLDERVDLVELHFPDERLKLKCIVIKGSELRTLELRGTPNLEKLTLYQCVDLVEHHLPDERLKLKSIKIINGSKLRTLDLRETPNLEKLGLHGCVDLVELHIPGECLKLKSIKIIDSKLRMLDLRGTPNLENLYLDECVDLVELDIPGKCLKLKSIKINGSKLRTLDLRGTPNLEYLNLDECVDLVELHLPDERLKLQCIVIKGSELRTLDLRGTPNLEKLTLYKCVDLVEHHLPDERLKLKSIKINGSKLRTLDLRGTPNLEYLNLDECVDLIELHLPDERLKLKCIVIKGSKLRTLDLRGTPNLVELNLDECVELVELHIPNESLKLEYIKINGSKLRTLDLRGTPNLQILNVTKCYHLVEVHAHDGCLKKLDFVELSGCLRFKPFRFSKRRGEVGCISKLHLIAESLEMCPLHFGNNLPNFRFECFYEERGSSLIGNVEKLLSFGLCACTNLERFSHSICGLRCLTKLTLEGSIPEAPKEFDRLECLEELNLLSTKIIHLPDSICKLKHLKCLKLDRCWLLEKLPEDLGRLECLEKLILTECVFLQHIPNSICIMKRLQYFLLPGCPAVEKLPEEIGHLKCLKELNIEGTNIRHLPESIFELKGLRIVGYRWLLQAYGFTSQIQTSEDETFFYVEL